MKPLNQNFSPEEIDNLVVERWKKDKTFEKSVQNRDEKNSYRFYDGPPFVTGLPHYGHLLGSIVKDVIPRYQTMKGKRVERVWGWDCHGLPVENKVEKQLGLNSKKDIETLGVEKFIDECRSYVKNVSSEWDWYVDHVGRWVDIKNAYRTMDRNYMESVIWVFKQLYDRDKIYKGNRVSLFCPRCSTPISNFEVAMDNSYKDVTDPSVYVKFAIKDQKDTYLLAWTTTPWTLPTNFALGVSSGAVYARVKHQDQEYILAKNLLAKTFGQLDHEVVEEVSGKSLVGLNYVPLYNYFEPNSNDHQVYEADFVSMDDGTGIVHIAPGFGEEDTALGKKHGLSLVPSVDDNGKLDPRIEVANNKYFKSADKLILEDLVNKGSIFRHETITHSYPHCYRCDTPLLYKSQDAWYIDIQSIKDRLKETNLDINWVPKHFKHGRFEMGIDSAPDWCISRSRYWGTPMPIWECTCSERKVFGSIKEIEDASGMKVEELHRPDIDKITIPCDKCGQKMHRIPEVLDCWVESASMPYAQTHYPFENKEKFTTSFPADFIVEYTGQLRAWFYVTHVISNLLNDSIAFKNVIVTGVCMGTDGRKMSKSYGNYPDPKEYIQKYGGDSLRLYLMGSPIVLGQDISVSEKDWAIELRSTIMMLWNSYKYFATYASIDKWERKSSFKSTPTKLDQWILTRLDQTIHQIDDALSSYTIPKSVAALKSFVDDLSTWYIRRSRDRVGPSATNNVDKELTYTTLNIVFENFFKAASPLIPFITDFLYQHLTEGESVHLQDWPSLGSAPHINQDLIDKMQLVRKAAEIGNSERKLKGVAIKQALSSVVIYGSFDDLVNEPDLLNLIKEELNVEKVTIVKSEEERAEYDLVITPELKEKGEAREIIRSSQEARKEAGCDLDEYVDLTLPSWPARYESEIKSKLLVRNLSKGDKLSVIRFS